MTEPLRTSQSIGFTDQTVFRALDSEKKQLDAIFKRYPEFKTLYQNELKNRLKRMGHKIEFNSSTGELHLLIKGVSKSWPEIKAEMTASNDEKKTPSFKSIPFGWVYNENGFVRRNAAKWDKLEPDWTDKTVDAVAGKCFIEVVSENNHLKQHCWVRLIDENKKVISVGLAGKFKWYLPFRKSRSFLISSDSKEFTDHFHKSVTTRFMIDKADYDKVKAKIEADQKVIEKRSFQYAKLNCSVYACEVLKEIGVQIDNKEFLTQAIGRKVTNKIGLKVPLFILKVFNFIAQVFRVLLSPVLIPLTILLGNFTTAAEQKKCAKKCSLEHPNQPKDKATFKKACNDIKKFLKDYLSGDLLKFNTGWKLTSWQKAVEQVRKIEVEKLSKEWMSLNQKDLTEAHWQAFENRLLQAKYGIPNQSKIKATPIDFVALKV